MGNDSEKNAGMERSGKAEQVLELLRNNQDGGQENLCRMAEDLLFFSELIGLQHSIIRLLRAGRVEFSGGLLDMAVEIVGMEIPVLEKWAAFMEYM